MKEKMIERFNKINKKSTYNLVAITKDDEIIEIKEHDFMGVFDAMFEKNIMREDKYFKDLDCSSEAMIKKGVKFSKEMNERKIKSFDYKNKKDLFKFNCWREDNYKDSDILANIIKYNNVKYFIINGELKFKKESEKGTFEKSLGGIIYDGNFK